MVKKILKMRAEIINRDQSKWMVTHAISVAERVSKEWHRTIYQLPNGVYVIRVPKQMLQPQKSGVKKVFWNIYNGGSYP